MRIWHCVCKAGLHVLKTPERRCSPVLSSKGLHDYCINRTSD